MTHFEAMNGYHPRYHRSQLELLSLRDKWTEPVIQKEEVKERKKKREQDAIKHAYDYRHYNGVKFGLGQVVVMKRWSQQDKTTKL